MSSTNDSKDDYTWIIFVGILLFLGIIGFIVYFLIIKKNCTPNCGTNPVCGDPDKCGGKCQGSCPEGKSCISGVCTGGGGGCTPNCGTNPVCGDSDKCGGKCQGTCPTQGQTCISGVCTDCTPNCGTNPVCGDPDKCGGKCQGTCPTKGKSCTDGVCVGNIVLKNTYLTGDQYGFSRGGTLNDAIDKCMKDSQCEGTNTAFGMSSLIKNISNANTNKFSTAVLKTYSDTKFTNPFGNTQLVGDIYNEHKGDKAYENAKSDCLKDNDCGGINSIPGSASLVKNITGIEGSTGEYATIKI